MFHESMQKQNSFCHFLKSTSEEHEHWFIENRLQDCMVDQTSRRRRGFNKNSGSQLSTLFALDVHSDILHELEIATLVSERD